MKVIEKLRVNVLEIKKSVVIIVLVLGLFTSLNGQVKNGKEGNDSNTPLHLLQPDYPVPYGKTTIADITKVLNRVYDYLDATTPPRLVSKQTGKEITNYQSTA